MIKEHMESFLCRFFKAESTSNLNESSVSKLGDFKKKIKSEYETKKEERKEYIVNIDKNKIYDLNIYSNLAEIEVKCTDVDYIKVILQNVSVLNNINDILLDISDGKSRVIDISLTYDNNKKIELDNGFKITILIPREMNISAVHLKALSLNIFVEDMYNTDRILLESLSGDIYIKNSGYNKLEIVNSDGCTKVMSCNLGKMLLKTINGDIIFEKVQSVFVKCKTNNGYIDVSKCKSKDLKFNSINGHILLSSIEAELIEAHSVNGDILLDNSSLENYRIKELNMETVNGIETILENYIA